jgi:hypothetical protein
MCSSAMCSSTMCRRARMSEGVGTNDGDLMVIVAAGIGYTWGAGCVEWG